MPQGTFDSNDAFTPAVEAKGSNGATGVRAGSDTGTGVSGTSDAGVGIDGTGAVGVSGSCNHANGTGVLGQGEVSAATGVQGRSADSAGVSGRSHDGTSVEGQSVNGTGVVAQSDNGIGLHAVGGGASESTPPADFKVAIFAEGGIFGEDQNAEGVIGTRSLLNKAQICVVTFVKLQVSDVRLDHEQGYSAPS